MTLRTCRRAPPNDRKPAVPSVLDAVALRAAVATPEGTYGALLGRDLLDEGVGATADEVLEVSLPGDDIELKRAYFHGIGTFDPQEEIAH